MEKRILVSGGIGIIAIVCVWVLTNLVPVQTAAISMPVIGIDVGMYSATSIVGGICVAAIYFIFSKK